MTSPAARPTPSPSEPIINSTQKKTLAAVGCATLIAAASTACGITGSANTAEAKVKKAFYALGQQKALSADVHFDANADTIYNALRGEEDFERRDADMLAELKLSYQVAYDKPLKDLGPDDQDAARAAFTISRDDGKPMVEVRSIGGKKLFARADLKTLAAMSHDSDKPDFDALARKAEQLPPSMDGLKNALRGEWVVLDTDAFQDSPSTSDRLDAKTQQQVFRTVGKALGDNAKYKGAPTRDGADHVKVTVPAKKAAKELAAGLKPLADKLGTKSDKLSRDLDGIPDQDVTVDVAIKNGMVSGLTVDLAQFDKKMKGELPLVFDIHADAPTVEAPSGAKEFNPRDIFGAYLLANRKDGTTVAI
ncbi:hypothetical protein [Streptomyces olivoreticuli]|uniref:hypothetical protein n=1 Tax=Streptomyces olivoreticuli TaxID=68246 RepID=UPI000E25A0FF|nr:hypothetical protein [Streptomyces olivoreticuli]